MAISTAAAILGGAAIGIGGSIIGGNKAADAAESAANTQAASADAATKVQWDMYNQARDDYSPFRDVGVESLSALQSAAGLPSRTFDQEGYDKALETSKAVAPEAMTGDGFGPNQKLYDSDPKYKQAYDMMWAEHLRRFGTTPAASKGSNLDVWQKSISDLYSSATGVSAKEPNKEDFYTNTPASDPFSKERGMLEQLGQGDYGADFFDRINKAGWVPQQREYISKLEEINPNINVDLSGQRDITSALGRVNTSAARDLSSQQDLTRRVGEIDPLAAQNYDRAQGYIAKADALNPNITFDENSPYFQASKSELMRTLNNRMSAQGLSGSSTSEDAIIRNILPLIEQEYGRQEGNYTRSLGQYGQLYGMETGLGGIRYGERAGDITREAGLLGQQYTQQQGTDQMGYTQGAGDIERRLAQLGQQYSQQSATDTFGYNTSAQNYDRASGQATNLFNMQAQTDATKFDNLIKQYGILQGADTDAFNRGVQTFGLENTLNNQGYNRLLDLTKIGAGAAGQAGSAALQTGTNVGNIQQASGAAIAQGQLAAGQQQANTWSNLGALPLQAYGQYQIGQYLTK